MELEVKSTDGKQVIDITDEIAAATSITNGVINLLAKHTTVGLTLADLDPGTDLDILDALHAIMPQLKWRHPHDPDHAPDHIWSAIIGTSLCLPIKDSQLVLGTWQRIILIELDGPKARQIELTELKNG